MKDIAIIGAGPAGITAALQIAKNSNFNVKIFESSREIGGMARTISLWDQLVDIGPHRFFSSDPRVNAIWLEAANGNFQMVNRLTRIYYDSKFFDYPLKPLNALRNLGLSKSLLCVGSYAKSKLFSRKDDSTFEGWVSNRFGKKLFEIFFKSYSEKLWGISCKDLDSDFATQRIKKLSLYEAVKSAFLGNRGNKHKTLVDEFAYPNMGAGIVYENMAKKFSDLGGKIFLNTPVIGISLEKDSKVKVSLPGGKEQVFDHVISTMPITQLVGHLEAPLEVKKAAKNLRFRNTILVYLEIDGSNPFPDQWIYVHSKNLQTGRITNFRNWVEDINNGKEKTILCLEYWCFNEGKWDLQDDELIQLGEDDIKKSGLIGDRRILRGMVVRVPKCYPIYESGYKEKLKVVEQYLSTIKAITPIGRYGAFKYNNQDHSILMGILAAENLCSDLGHDLWSINTDYEYQESSKITATGLVTI